MFDPNQFMFSANRCYPNVPNNYSVPTNSSSFQSNFSNIPISVPNNHVNSQFGYQNNNYGQQQHHHYANLFQPDLYGQHFAGHPSIARESEGGPSPKVPNVDETSDGKVNDNKRVGKNRYTDQQTMLLEEVFEKYKYVTRRFSKEQRAALMEQTGLTQMQLRYWFNNRRVRATKQGININYKNEMIVGLKESPQCKLGTSVAEKNETSIVNDAANETDETPTKKRNRLVYDDESFSKLENAYKRTRYLSRSERTELAAACKLPELRVKSWFQNRRMKEKRAEKKAGILHARTGADENATAMENASQISAGEKIKQETSDNSKTSESLDVKNLERKQMPSHHQNVAFNPTNPNHLLLVLLMTTLIFAICMANSVTERSMHGHS